VTGPPDAPAPGRTRSLRRRALIAFAVLVPLALVVAVWVGLGLRSAALGVRAHADGAQTSLEQAKRQLLAGELDAARASTDVAKQQVADAAQAADALPVRLAGRVPVVGTAVDDLDHLIAAAGDLASASAELVDVYAVATGEGTGTGIFTRGAADFAVMRATGAAVEDALDDAVRAQESLRSVEATLPGTGSLAGARDSALQQVDPLVAQLELLRAALARLPDAFGEDGQKRYLVVTLNPAELLAGGGASLSAAVLQFSDGRLSIPVQGSVSSSLFPGNPVRPWDHVASLPYFTERQMASFAVSNLHPDFAITAQEMQRAWVANGQRPVDGVIALDPVALASVVQATGPIETAAYGRITGDNLVRKLLVDAYGEFEADQRARHKVNDALVAQTFARLSAGDDTLAVARALAVTAPEQHVRVHLDDPELQKVVDEAGMSGRLPDADAGDAVAVFSQNRNASKVDIFQERDVRHEVTLAADGSAEVVTTMTATYDVPRKARTSEDRRGYLTRWSFNWYFAYLPSGAELVDYSAPRRDPEDAPDDPTVYEDLDGWRVVRVGRWTEAGGSTTVTMTYRFPAGTFTGGDGSGLAYTLSTAPQAMLAPTALSVSVTGPGTAALSSSTLDGWTLDGSSATWSGDLARPSRTSLTWS
jgi:hypothetical protein